AGHPRGGETVDGNFSFNGRQRQFIRCVHIVQRYDKIALDNADGRLGVFAFELNQSHRVLSQSARSASASKSLRDSRSRLSTAAFAAGALRLAIALKTAS